MFKFFLPYLTLGGGGAQNATLFGDQLFLLKRLHLLYYNFLTFKNKHFWEIWFKFCALTPLWGGGATKKCFCGAYNFWNQKKRCHAKFLEGCNLWTRPLIGPGRPRKFQPLFFLNLLFLDPSQIDAFQDTLKTCFRHLLVPTWPGTTWYVPTRLFLLDYSWLDLFLLDLFSTCPVTKCCIPTWSILTRPVNSWPIPNWCLPDTFKIL